MFQHNHWDVAHVQRPGRPEARFTGNDLAVGINENWVYEAEFPDGGGDLRYLFRGVRAGVGIGRNESIQRPALDL